MSVTGARVRLITRRAIYRAFPELDRFDDERCARFVRAAGRGFWKKLRGYTAMVLGAAAIMASLYGLVLLIARILERSGRGYWLDSWPFWLIAFVGVFPVAAGVFGGAWTRDLHLRRRIRRVLRSRGVCLGCRYTLVGLPVEPGNSVKCPECGAESEVDPSLGELAVGDDGRARFKPSEDPLKLGPRFWTPQRVARLRRWAIRLAIGIPAAAILLAGSYEVFVRWQASVARRERPGVAEIRAFMERGGPSGELPVGVNAWSVLGELESLRLEINDATGLPDDGAQIGSPEMPDFSSLISDERPDYLRDDAAATAQFERQRESARRLMRAYEERGWFSRLGELRAADHAVIWPMASSTAQPAMESLYVPETGVVFPWVRILRARMAMAEKARDAAKFGEALETLFTLSWMMRSTPSVYWRSAGTSIDAMAFREIRRVLPRAERPWLDAIENAMARRRPGASMEATLRGDELLTLEAVAWVFEDPSNARLGRFSAKARQMVQSNDYRTPLGTYGQNRAEVQRLFAYYRDLAARPSLVGAPPENPAPRFIPLRHYGPWLGRFCEIERLANLDEFVLRAMITLERYRHDRGGYPDSLDQLGGLIVKPIDPWTGQSVLYRKIDAQTDPQKRGYLLYSVGADGADDGGKSSASAAYRSLFITNAGTDFILNDRER